MSLGPLAIASLAAALFGAATPTSKWLLGALTPLQLAGLLYLGAALGVAPAVLRAGSLAFPRDRTGRLRLLGAVALGGGLAPVLLLLGLRLASAASVALWLNLELAATALLGALLFHDRLGAAGWLGAGWPSAQERCSRAARARGLAAGALVAAACVCWAFDNHWTALIDGVPAAATHLLEGRGGGPREPRAGRVSWLPSTQRRSASPPHSPRARSAMASASRST